MSTVGNALGLAWTIAAWWFIASVVAAPIFLVIRNARARSKRLFVDQPTARITVLHPDTRIDHRWDA